MRKQECLECKFIDTEMKFYTMEDFKENAEAIKNLYRRLPNKLFYQWYVYANLDLTIEQKDLIWEYLNGYINVYDIIEEEEDI